MKVVVFAYHNIGCTGLRALQAAGFDIAAVFTHKIDAPLEFPGRRIQAADMALRPE